MNDLSMAKRNQMLDRFFDTDGIIENDIAHPLADDAEIVKNNTGFFSLASAIRASSNRRSSK